MTPNEVVQLRTAEVTVSGHVVLVSIASIFFGISIPMFSFAGYIFWRRGFQSRSTKVMTLATIFCFVMAIFILAGKITIMAAAMQTFNIIADLAAEGFTIGRKRPDSITRHIFQGDVVADWGEQLAICVSDAIVVWRAWVLFGDRSYLMVLPLLLLLGTVATSITVVVFLAWYKNWHEFVTGGAAAISLINIIGGYLSIGTNAVATFLIGYKLWRHRRLISSRDRRLARRVSPVQKALLIIVESGVFFCAFEFLGYLLQTLIDHGNLRGSAAGLATGAIVQSISSISSFYPVMVLILVHTQKAVTEYYHLTKVDVTVSEDTANSYSMEPISSGSAGRDL